MAPSNPSGPASEPAAAPPLCGREDDLTTLTDLVTGAGRPHITLAGSHGSGKTLVARQVLAGLPDRVTRCYLSCTRVRTQYLVLRRLAELLSGEEVNTGYHTAQLFNRVLQYLDDRETVLVLDDVAFLLRNDGDDLLYGLSRLNADHALQLILVSATGQSVPPAVDARTYSSLQPHQVTLPPYDTEQVRCILTAAIDEWEHLITDAALEVIAETTANIRLARHWVRRVTEVVSADTWITPAHVRSVQADAAQRYRRALVKPFSPEHTIVLRAIEQLAADREHIYSGDVYDRYELLCRYRGRRTLSTRRISDYLKHLELLGLIDVEYYNGGPQGKTREIRLVPIEQL